MSYVPFIPASDQNMDRIATALESTARDPSIAEIYDNTSTYDVGRYVKHDGILYKCITAITTPEPWTAAHWREVKLANEVSEVNEKIGNTNLPTTAQTLTGAIDEHESDLTSVNDKIGTLSDLKTSSKTNLVSATNSLFDKIANLFEQNGFMDTDANQETNCFGIANGWLQFSNYPSEMTGHMATMTQIWNYGATIGNLNENRMQTLVLDDGNVFVRYFSNSTWSNWTSSTDNIMNLQRHTRLTDFNLADLQAAAADQNLAKHGLKPGDQKTINGYTYVIAGPNVIKGTHGYTCTGNHIGLIVIPHTTHAWNASGRTDYTSTGSDNRGGGYKNSDLHQYLKTDVLNHCKADLGADHLYAHQKLLGSAVNPSGYNRFGTNSGCTSSWAWEECYISALTESQVYGGIRWSSSGYDTGEANTILPVFAEYKHTDIFGNEYVWLRDVSSASQACSARHYGLANGEFGVGNAHFVAGLILYH